jgi:hypothetical protein
MLKKMDALPARDGSMEQMGDARAAAEAIEAWLREQAAARHKRAGMLEAMQAGLVELGRAVEGLGDARAASLYQDLGRAMTMDELHAGLDALAARIAAAARSRNRRAAIADRPARKTRTLIRL